MKKIMIIAALVAVALLRINMYSAAANPLDATVRPTVMGLESLFVSVPVEAYVVFEIRGGYFVDNISPQDFTVTGLPRGLVLGTPRRHSNVEVLVPIYGTPVQTSTTPSTLTFPSTIHHRNILDMNTSVPVTPTTHTLGNVLVSAQLGHGSVLFDLNPYGVNHRAVTVHLRDNEIAFRNVFYGSVLLLEDVDYLRYENFFTLSVSFLSRLPQGQWPLTFTMAQGHSPELTLSIIDTASQPPADDFYHAPGMPITPPMAPPTPDDTFATLSGGLRVDVSDLPNLHPQFIDGRAWVGIRTHVLDYLAWRRPGGSFCIVTPQVRLCVPATILDELHSARMAIIERGMAYEDVELRILLTDVSNAPGPRAVFNATYPGGQIMSPLIDLQMQLVYVPSELVIHTVPEFLRPLDMTFTAMGTGAFLRPAGLHIIEGRVDYVPHRLPQPNEVTVRTRFPGIYGAMHNATHFHDLAVGHWAFDSAFQAAYSGLVPAFGNLNPYTNVTRGEFVQLIVSALQLPRFNIPTTGFADIESNHSLADAVRRANAAGLLSLWANQPFQPSAIITRQEAAAIAGRAAMLFGATTAAPEGRPLASVFADSHEITTYHFPLMQFAIDANIVVGYPDGTFRPNAAASRIYSLAIVTNLARSLGLLD